MPNRVIIPQIIGLLNEGHTVTLKLRGISMRPFLEDNRDKALLKKAELAKVGDAVLAEVGDKVYVLHRIARIEGNEVTLQGDGNLTTEHCRMSDIHGIAVGFYRKGRDRLDTTDGMKWKVYSFIWTKVKPLRRYLLAFHRRIILPLQHHKERQI